MRQDLSPEPPIPQRETVEEPVIDLSERAEPRPSVAGATTDGVAGDGGGQDGSPVDEPPAVDGDADSQVGSPSAERSGDADDDAADSTSDGDANPMGADDAVGADAGVGESGSPVREAAADGEPTGGEPVGAEPVGGEPTGAEPTGAEPTGAEPTGAEPTGAEPTGAEPTGAEPGEAAEDDVPGASAEQPAADTQPLAYFPGPEAEAPAAPGRARSFPKPKARTFLRMALRLSLSRRVGAGASPAGWILMAWAWSLGAVLLGCLLSAAAIGAVTRSGLPDVTVFVDCWRVSHLMPLQTAEGQVSFVPMLPAFAVIAVLLRANRWLWTRVRARPDCPVRTGHALAGLAGGYIVAAGLIATSPTRDTAASGPTTQGLAALVLLVALPSLWMWGYAVLRPARPRFWRLMRAVGVVLGALFVLAFLALTLQLLMAWGEYWGVVDGLLSDAEQPATWIDVAALGLLQLLYAPNALVWAGAYLVGAGFSVGDATIVSPFSVELGTVPEFPLATLIPTAPLAWPLLPPILVALGSFIAGVVMRVGASPRQTALRSAAAVAIAVLCAIAMAVLAAAAGGGLGQGRLSVLGPDPVMTGLATLVVIGTGQVLWALFPTLAADVRPIAVHLGRRLRTLRVPRRGTAAAPSRHVRAGSRRRSASRRRERSRSAGEGGQGD